jgi:glycosyltransferase involved in cell wall biosynthesis
VNNSYRQILPDLAEYRRDLSVGVVGFPLPPVPRAPDGLRSVIPSAPTNRKGWPWDKETPADYGPVTGWPKVTIVIPSFQQGDFIEETLRSVLLQNYPILECIVIDGGSTDQTSAIIEKYRPWLSFARSGRDRGQGHAINLGFSLGSGDIFGWLNSDDFYLPGALRRVAECWKRTRAEFIYGDSLDLEQTSLSYAHSTANVVADRYVRFPGLVASHAAFWAANRHQPIWEEQHCALDYELWIRLLPGLRKSYVHWPLGVFRQHTAAKSYDAKIKERWDEDALRNGQAHPELYGSSFSDKFLAFEFRAVQRAFRSFRRHGLTARLNSLRSECAWGPIPITKG